MSDPASSANRRPLATGKVPPDLLSAVFGSNRDARVIQGSGVGLDAAVIEWGGRALVAASDPITFVDSNAGRLAVAVNANDIFAVGAEPQWMLATVLAPEGVDAAAIQELLADLTLACAEAGVALVGGHTEITDAVVRSVVSCTLIGTAAMDEFIPSNGAADGDVIIQAGAAAVEGTAILGYPQLLDDPGISVAAAARALRAVDGVHAMHDVTEGGIATAALELAESAGRSPQLVGDDVIWLPQTMAVCSERDLDPLGLLGSGTLLAAVSPGAVERALSALSNAGVQASAIGRVAAGSPATLRFGGQMGPLPRFERDEALRAFDDARRSTP
ncbi:MAG: AIR synthase related protein [Chloroflexota bacterium]|nr:AIR synthase related protein [Chloroflexota bacterium]